MNQLSRGQAARAHALLKLNTGFKINGFVFDDRTESGSVKVCVHLTGKCEGRNSNRAKQTKSGFHDVLPWFDKTLLVSEFTKSREGVVEGMSDKTGRLRVTGRRLL